NQTLTFPATLASGGRVSNPNRLGTIAFPRTNLLAITSIYANSAQHFDSAIVKIQSSDAAILASAATLHNKALLMGNLYAQTLGQDIPATKDGERFRRIMQAAIAKNDHQRPIGEIMQAIANQFLGAAYKANLLDQSQEETLVVNLNQFDCLLFVETVLAIARGVAVQDYSYSTFVHHLGNQRYWDGQINGYCSRLHYFSQWIYDNQKRGTVQNMGQPLGGVLLNKRLNFMSSHRQRYPQMANNETKYNCIVERETQLNGVTIDYIPTSNIRRLYSQLQPGDIIGVATSISGLDVTHTGLVYRQPNGNIGFIHASPAGQVTIARDLHRYVSRVNNAIGILVARPLDPRQTKGANQLGRL
ncbi:MAG TPA: N-acetylmuramoyl-L-alanine amidase-like domain-containing protein, partial [Coleofasciculaceae cyanobacterium]